MAVSRLDYRLLRFLAVPAYGLSLVLSSLVLVVGREYNGSKRWLALGPLSFQPAEFAKVAVILLLAWAVDRKKGRMEKMRSLIGVLLLLLPIVALVGTNNLSTAVIILGIGFLLIFLSTPRYVPFVFMGAAGAGLVAVFLGMESYRLERLMIWRHPENYEKGYQTIQGLYAIGSGGVFGQGLGSSMQKLGFVPEAQNDMIFSIICEELGLVGALALILTVFPDDLAIHGHCHARGRPVRGAASSGHHGPHRHPGHFEHCGGDQFHPQYRGSRCPSSATAAPQSVFCWRKWALP